MDHGIQAVTLARIATVSRAEMQNDVGRTPEHRAGDVCGPTRRCRHPRLDSPASQRAHVRVLEQRAGKEEHAVALAELSLGKRQVDRHGGAGVAHIHPVDRIDEGQQHDPPAQGILVDRPGEAGDQRTVSGSIQRTPPLYPAAIASRSDRPSAACPVAACRRRGACGFPPFASGCRAAAWLSALHGRCSRANHRGRGPGHAGRSSRRDHPAAMGAAQA